MKDAQVQGKVQNTVKDAQVQGKVQNTVKDAQVHGKVQNTVKDAQVQGKVQNTVKDAQVHGKVQNMLMHSSRRKSAIAVKIKSHGSASPIDSDGEYIAMVKTGNECQLSVYMLLHGNNATAVCCAEVLFQPSFSLCHQTRCLVCCMRNGVRSVPRNLTQHSLSAYS